MKDLTNRTYAKLNDYCSSRGVSCKYMTDMMTSAGLLTWRENTVFKRDEKRKRWMKKTHKRSTPTSLASSSGALSPYTGRRSGFQWNIRALDMVNACGVLPEHIWKPSKQ